MHRRPFVAAVVSAGLAGCVSDGGASGTPTERPEDHVTAATNYLEDAGDRIDDESQHFGDFEDGVSFSTAAIFTALDRADEELTSAKSATDDEELLARIEALESTSSFLRSFTEALSDFEDGMNGLSTATSYTDSDRYEDAAETAGESGDAFAAGREDLVAAEEHRQAMDADASDEFDDVSLVDLRDRVEQLRELFEAMETFADGYVALNEGFERYDAATVATEDENWSEAATEFEAARDRFDDGARRFENGEADAPDQFTSHFVDLLCLAESLRDASGHFVDAVEAVERGDRQTYQEKLDQAESAASRCE